MVREPLRRTRLAGLMHFQRQGTAELYGRFVGIPARVMIDRIADEPQGRAAWQADDGDGIAYVPGAELLAPGTIVDAVIEGIEEDIDVRATLLRVVDAPAAPPTRGRALPGMGTAVGG